MSGLRPRIPAACRAALRELLNGGEAAAHVETCAFCMARVRASGSVSRWLREELAQKPAMPPIELDGVYERVTEQAEDGSLGRWIESAAVAPPSAVSSSDDLYGEGLEIGAELAESLVRAPEPPAPSVWSDVRRSILDGVQAERVVRLRSRRTGLRVLLLGAAASAVIWLFTIADRSPEPPTIQFIDLDRAPDSPFAIVRYGSRQ